MKVSTNAWKNGPVLGTMLGLVALSALGLAYWSNVQDRERYLQSRNFRLLADMVEQTDALLADADQMLRRAIRVSDPTTEENKRTLQPNADIATVWARQINVRLPGSQLSSLPDDAPDGVDQRIVPVDLKRGHAEVPQSSASPSAIVAGLPRARTRVTGGPGVLRLAWVPPAANLPTLAYELPAHALLAEAFSPVRWQRAFSTMALATPDGRIVFASGRQAAEIEATSATALLAGRAEGERRAQVPFGSGITHSEVELAGVWYEMFTQPCCGVEGVASGSAAPAEGLVLIGLAESEVLRSLSLAISPVLVLAGAAFVMACFASWAFLKCWLMGAHQRFARHDVINLLTSGVFGMALATVLLLTIASYARLSIGVDARLEQLGVDLNRQFRAEIDAATLQMKQLTDQIRVQECRNVEPPRPPIPGQQPDDPCQPIASTWNDPRARDDRKFAYPRFTMFSLIDESGLQAVKAADTDQRRQVVDVQERRYHRQAQSGVGLWQTPQCPLGCYLEYVWSWNTGQPQVVLASPTGIPRLPVAAMAIPMTPLLKPVLPPGFEFAIIDRDGIAQIHSDSHRNGFEDVLLETDQNPRMRSLVGAHAAGVFNTTYWGSPYRAHVRPTVIPGWSIVVMHSKQATRALVLEWFIVAMLMQTIYTAVFLIVLLIVLRKGGPWLWPDPLRRHWYAPLACLGLVAVAVWLVVAETEPIRTTVVVGAITPFALWAVAFAVLGVRQPGVGTVTKWAELCRDYRFAGTVLLVITAAVPAASFYAMSYDRHIEAFVKERQISLAQRVSSAVCAAEKDDAMRAAAIQSPSSQSPPPTRYDHPDFDGVLSCVDEPSPREQQSPSALSSFVHAALEDGVPYFTSASVALRELMHWKAEDLTWESYRYADGRQHVWVAASNPEHRVLVERRLPVAIGLTGGLENRRIVMVAAGALLLLVVVVAAGYFVVSFLLRRVLLADIVEPIPPYIRLVTRVGQHVHVVGSDPTWLAARVSDVQEVPLTRLAAERREWTAQEMRTAIAELEPGQRRLAIADFEPPVGRESLEPSEVELFRRKLEFLSTLMAVPTETVLLFTERTARELEAFVRRVFDEPGEAERWVKVLKPLAVVELPQRSTTTTLERWLQELRQLRRGWRDEFVNRWQDWRVPLRWRARLLEVEGQSDPTIDTYCSELERRPEFKAGSLTRDQILEEIEEKADDYYRDIWHNRRDDERVVLEHVARHGFASAASRRTVRRLLAAGYLRKDPALRLMNESFRRFVLDPERRQEVAAIESQAGPSMWDRWRVPIAVSGLIAFVFLLVTQREALDSTVSMALGVTTAVPTLVKLTNLLAQIARPAEAKPNA